MEYTDLLDAFDESRGLIVESLRVGDPTVMVPTCPAFTLDRLAFHIGEFSSFWTHVVCEATGRVKTPFPQDPGPAGRLEWVDELTAHLVGQLRMTASETPCWTWYSPDQTAGFVAARACHELAIHRVDVQLAARGAADPIDASVASAGIEEVFLLLAEYGVDGQRGTPGNGETLQLHGTDHEPADWFVRLGRDKTTVSREHTTADLTISASVSDLEMLLYQRPATASVAIVGDPAVLDAFYGEFTFS